MFGLLLAGRPPVQGGGGGGSPLLLDTLGSAYKAAYSTRKVRAGHAGPCLNVRRGSDNASTDIGFSSGWADIAALTTFAGSASVFVTKWYDQSGNGNDAVQATSTNQPRIVNAGAVDNFGDSNSRPCIVFGGASQALRVTMTTGRTDTRTGSFAVASGGTAGSQRLLSTTGNGTTADYNTNGVINAIIQDAAQFGIFLTAFYNGTFYSGPNWSASTRNQAANYIDGGNTLHGTVNGGTPALVGGFTASIAEPRTVTIGNSATPDAGSGWIGRVCEILYFADAPATGDEAAARTSQQTAFGTG
jgi:hypothetical protein